MNNRKSHDILEKGLQILVNLDHRGAVGADPKLGDGCGVLTQIPHAFFAPECAKLGFDAAGAGPLRDRPVLHAAASRAPRQQVREDRRGGRRRRGPEPARLARRAGRQFRPWRARQGGRAGACGRSSSDAPPSVASEDDFERRALSSCARSSPTASTRSGRRRSLEYYPVSMSCRTIVYKGMVLVAPARRPITATCWTRASRRALALVHQRFATNTFPSWRLAHPYRMVAHNGEINTLRGNVNWMAARQASVDSELFGNDISKLWPISYEGQSDTACFDNALEFLVQGGYSLSPCDDDADPGGLGRQSADGRGAARFLRISRRADGAVGRPGRDRLHGRTPDRRDARPQRPAARALFRHRRRPRRAGVGNGRAAGPGREASSPSGACSRARCCWSISSSTASSRTTEIKQTLSRAHPYSALAQATRQIVLEDLQPGRAARVAHRRVAARSPAGLRLHAGRPDDPARADGGRPARKRSARWARTRRSRRCPTKSKLLYTYFKQNFAQVTNPPIDPIREELVMSLVSFIGPRPNLFDLEGTRAGASASRCASRS